LIFTFSIQTFAVDFTVNLTSDQHDANIGDCICDINSATPESECTLRAAVEQSNSLGGFTRVLFNLPDNSTITLTIANGGEIPISNSGTLQIIGTGANNLTTNGGAGTNRIFSTIEATVTILGVTLTGGNATGVIDSEYGGAILAYKGSLTLDSIHVTGNTASGFSGGGVYFLNGTHRIINSTFSANTAYSCGGFRNENGTLTVVNSTISGNTANYGGGFCNYGNTTLRNVTILLKPLQFDCFFHCLIHPPIV